MLNNVYLLLAIGVQTALFGFFIGKMQQQVNDLSRKKPCLECKLYDMVTRMDQKVKYKV